MSDVGPKDSRNSNAGSDVELDDDYKTGGYHPVKIGDIYINKLKVIKKLGWGHFSTVWLCEDLVDGGHVALKIQKSAKNYSEAASDEIDIHRSIHKKRAAPKSLHPMECLIEDSSPVQDMSVSDNINTSNETRDSSSGNEGSNVGISKEMNSSSDATINDFVEGTTNDRNYEYGDYVVKFTGTFEITGPNGIHIAMTFEVMGPNLLLLIKLFDYKGINFELLKKISRDLLRGLDFLHSECGVIHTDIKPENILVSFPSEVSAIHVISPQIIIEDAPQEKGPLDASLEDGNDNQESVVSSTISGIEELGVCATSINSLTSLRLKISNKEVDMNIIDKTSYHVTKNIPPTNHSINNRNHLRIIKSPIVSPRGIRRNKYNKHKKGVLKKKEKHMDVNNYEHRQLPILSESSPSDSSGRRDNSGKRQFYKVMSWIRRKLLGVMPRTSKNYTGFYHIYQSENELNQLSGNKVVSNKMQTSKHQSRGLRVSKKKNTNEKMKEKTEFCRISIDPNKTPTNNKEIGADFCSIHNGNSGSFSDFPEFSSIPLSEEAVNFKDCEFNTNEVFSEANIEECIAEQSSIGNMENPKDFIASGSEPDNIDLKVTASVSDDSSHMDGLEISDESCQYPRPIDSSSITIKGYDRKIFERPDAMFKLADLGNSCWSHKHFTPDIQTRQYRSPEVILKLDYCVSADIWSLACALFELATGDYLFDPESGDDFDRDDDHLTLFVELLGPFPSVYQQLAKSVPNNKVRHFISMSGEPKRISNYKTWSIRDVLIEKYEFNEYDANQFGDFLLAMLRLDPAQRATASEMLQHSWLSDISIK